VRRLRAEHRRGDLAARYRLQAAAGEKAQKEKADQPRLSDDTLHTHVFDH
jgi:hypothetical protein